MNRRFMETFVFQSFFILILISSIQSVHGMNSRTAMNAFLKVNESILKRALGNEEFLKGSEDFLIIDDYSAERDEEACKKITEQNYNCLANTNSSRDQSLVWTQRIAPVLSNASIVRKVCIVEGVTVGFINYRFCNPWYKNFFNRQNQIKQTCNVIHLAVDQEFQGHGVGSALLQEAIDDCQRRSVSQMFLVTVNTHPRYMDLYRFYYRFGFRPVWRFGRSEVMYALQPDREWVKQVGEHPFFEIIREIRNSFGSSDQN